MGYYEVLEEVNRLRGENIYCFTALDISNNTNIDTRRVVEQLNKMIREGTIKRTIVKDGKGTIAKYTYVSGDINKTTEGFINGVFEVISRLIP